MVGGRITRKGGMRGVALGRELERGLRCGGEERCQGRGALAIFGEVVDERVDK